MNRTVRIIIGVIIGIAALMWLVDVFRLIFDPSYELTRFAQGVAAFVTSLWLFGAIASFTKDD